MDNNDHSKTCMKNITGPLAEYLESAMAMHAILYVEGRECTDIKCKNEDCDGEWTFDYGAEGHFCSGSCQGYDGWK